jgi:hypothetical protein
VHLQPTTSATQVICRSAGENIMHAIRYATARQRPFNTHITLSFTDLGVGAVEAGSFFSAIRNGVARRWKREREQKGRPIGTFDDAYVHEHPGNGRRHVHWLLHRPVAVPVAELETAIRVRVARRAGLDDLGTALHFQHDDVVKAPGMLGKYLLKGLDPRYGGYYRIRTENMGVIVGRRSGASRSVGLRARKLAGWRRKGGSV